MVEVEVEEELLGINLMVKLFLCKAQAVINHHLLEHNQYIAVER
jgi:hypothetical protein